jgi:hypothetical protein
LCRSVYNENSNILKKQEQIMEPYSRGTSQSTGKMVETFYDQPILLALVVLVFAGLLYWKVKKSDE